MKYGREKKIIPLGFCQCGCGKKSGVYPRTQSMFGHVSGQPRKFIFGHSRRIITKTNPGYTVDAVTGCWIWRMQINPNGYGKIRQTRKRNGKLTSCLAHKAIYEQKYGPVKNGLHLDHLCCNKACVNPDHLEPVTSLENRRRFRDWVERMKNKIIQLEGMLERRGIRHSKFRTEFTKRDMQKPKNT